MFLLVVMLLMFYCYQCWGPEGYHLMVAGNGTSGKFIQISFFKSCLATNPNMVGTVVAVVVVIES